MASSPRPFLNTREVADLLGVTDSRVRQLVASGAIPSVRLSPRRILIPARSLDRLADDAIADHAERRAASADR